MSPLQRVQRLQEYTGTMSLSVPPIDVELLNINFNETESNCTTPLYDNWTTPSYNCTDDAIKCLPIDVLYKELLEYVFPNAYEWVLIAMHTVVFTIGLIGNALVCVVVYRNQTMRTVTNYFIVNLAMADFMVVLVCLPPTVAWDVTETWFLGNVMCKLVLYIQNVSVSLSVLTLTFISLDRWYAICYPLKFKSTTSRAKTVILIIWIISFIISIPELLVLHTQPNEKVRERIDTIFLTECIAYWSDQSENAYRLLLAALLYVAPLFLMSVTYYQIVRVLWQDDIPGSSEVKNHVSECNGRKSILTPPNASSVGQIRSRRKAAKMLIAVVIMFAVCYFPVHLINILRYTTTGLDNNDVTITFSNLSHWLCYANSSMNPIIYNFMSGKFRREFKRVFRCDCARTPLRHRSAMSIVSHVNVYPPQ